MSDQTAPISNASRSTQAQLRALGDALGRGLRHWQVDIEAIAAMLASCTGAGRQAFEDASLVWQPAIRRAQAALAAGLPDDDAVVLLDRDIGIMTRALACLCQH